MTMKCEETAPLSIDIAPNNPISIKPNTT